MLAAYSDGFLKVKKEASAKEAILKYSKDFNGTLSDADVMKLAGISRNTYYRYKGQLRAEISADRDCNN